MPDLLFEIGTEELPASAVATGSQQLEALLRARLSDLRLAFEATEAFATPRRLAVLVRSVASAQEAMMSERRGPAVGRAFDTDGNPTKAVQGFAKANSVVVSDLERRVTDQGEYVYAIVNDAGRPAEQVLADALSAVVGGLELGRTMKWDASGLRFPRPIRWLVALLDDNVLDFKVGELTAGRTSVGHRVFHPAEVEIPTASAYVDVMSEAGVSVRTADRIAAIREQALDAAGILGGTPIISDDLLEEVVALVEQPVAMTGRFDDSYLKLPACVLVTAMQAHQRYFPVASEDGDLLAGFVVISNADPKHADRIVAGNQRVIRARLEDAAFFYAEDTKVSFGSRVDGLSGLVMHRRLGSVLDHVKRVSALLEHCAASVGLTEFEASIAARAAHLSKADLQTHLVFEFPELQGVMGAEYIRRDPALSSEDGVDAVATAVAEHYQPKFAGDALPSSRPGAALAIMDRFDTLVGYIGIGLAPTGSEDPYALRRAAGAIATIALEFDLQFDVDDVVEASWAMYTGAGIELGELQECRETVRTLLAGRVEASFEDADKRLLEAVRNSAWNDLPDLAARIDAVLTAAGSGWFADVVAACERPANIVGSAQPLDTAPAKLEHPAEIKLSSALDAVEGQIAELVEGRRYTDVLEALTQLTGPIDTFFDKDRGVMVMADDPAVRQARLELMRRTAAVSSVVADLSKIDHKDLRKAASA